MDVLPLSAAERVTFALRSLYRSRGYSQYKMNKFEEYDLYARNKDFLISDSVITFTDKSGRLMALKPDVTLSIIKNSADLPDSLQKVYYNENVYRADKGAGAFREIMQVGLECIGAIDDYSICEVISLAAESLCAVSPDCVLDISHLGFLRDVIAALGIPQQDCGAALRLIGEKNVHELKKLCTQAGLSAESTDILCSLVATCGEPKKVIPALISLLSPVIDTKPLKSLQKIVTALQNSALPAKLRVDFSVVDDINYYNGIVFKGYINGVPTDVLSGGQYDGLMRRMGRRSGAIGFAVYLDALTRLFDSREEYDVDTVLLYGEDELSDIAAAAERLGEQGLTVMTVRTPPQNIKYRQVLRLKNGEVEAYDNA